MKDSNISRDRTFSPGRDEQDALKAPAEKDLLRAVHEARNEAYFKAIDSLGRYKFEMFGYWASAWVKYNQLLKGTGHGQPNPFRQFVHLARGKA
jgi:hypothetical protein